MHLETSSNIYGRTVNPYNRDLTCGGSSGGEAALIGMRGSVLVCIILSFYRAVAEYYRALAEILGGVFAVQLRILVSMGSSMLI